MKTCIKCGILKPLFEFHKSKSYADGYRNLCKECRKYDSRVYYLKSSDKIKAYQKYYRETHTDRVRERQKRHRLENSDHYREKQKVYRKNHRKEETARKKVGRYVSKGKIKRLPCEICGEKQVHAHHEDYNKPLEVIWLCSKHHHWIHCHVPSTQIGIYTPPPTRPHRIEE